MKSDKGPRRKPKPSAEGSTPVKKPEIPKKASRRVAPKANPPSDAAAPAEQVRPPKGKPALRGPLTRGRKPLEVPPILLEGDAAPAPSRSGPGERYVLGETSPVASASQEESGQLPEAYGTQRILLAARDPHWVYASWDLTQKQLREYNAQSRDDHLILRVYMNDAEGKPHVEIHVHPESRNWFAYVGEAERKYVAELGYYTRKGVWTRISLSKPTFTPPDSLSADTSEQFATIPTGLSFKELVEIVKEVITENIPLVRAIQALRQAGDLRLPALPKAALRQWTPAQAKALAEVLTIDNLRRVWMGSLEITELLRRHLQRDASSQAAAGFGVREKEAISSISSPFGGMPGAKSFWFNVNAELIIYGATEPDASVTVGERKIQLRPDGSFSYRFALPDGNFHLPIRATAADRSEQRAAELTFSRQTEYQGSVGKHSQDENLKTPRPENVS